MRRDEKSAPGSLAGGAARANHMTGRTLRFSWTTDGWAPPHHAAMSHACRCSRPDPISSASRPCADARVGLALTLHSETRSSMTRYFTLIIYSVYVDRIPYVLRTFMSTYVYRALKKKDAGSSQFKRVLLRADTVT